MRVRMRAHISGARNGTPWPRPGETFEVDDTEGAELCRAGIAVPVAEPDADVETPEQERESAEERAPAPRKTTPRASTSRRSTRGRAG